MLFGCTRRVLPLLRRQRVSTVNRRTLASQKRTDSDVTLCGRGIVVGCYETGDGSNKAVELSKSGQRLNDHLGGKLLHLMKISGLQMKKGESRLFYDLSEEFSHVAVVSVGEREPCEHQEGIDLLHENVRSAAAVGVQLLQKSKVKEIVVEDFSDPTASAEGSFLSLYKYEEAKGSDKKSSPKPKLEMWSQDGVSSSSWEEGSIFAEAQNFARKLMDTPANLMTPSLFVDAVSRRLGDVPGAGRSQLEVIPRPLSWIQAQGMGAFLCIAKGSDEVPWLMEVRYNGGRPEEKPLVLVGKGVTFDTGGLSIKPAAGMPLMKGDMGGAACVAATMLAIATLNLPINVVSLMPLGENMISGRAVKPGDVVKAMNGKSIQVDNTDAEGRLLLADALCYAHSFHPTAIVDLATLTGAMMVALGSGASGMFSTSSTLPQLLLKAGRATGDRVWPMPLFQQYSKQIESEVADISNIGKRGRYGGPCTAAAFLKEFVQISDWVHLDIAGVMESHGELPYLSKGMSGRPTRTLIELVRHLASK